MCRRSKGEATTIRVVVFVRGSEATRKETAPLCDRINTQHVHPPFLQQYECVQYHRRSSHSRANRARILIICDTPEDIHTHRSNRRSLDKICQCPPIGTPFGFVVAASYLLMRLLQAINSTGRHTSCGHRPSSRP